MTNLCELPFEILQSILEYLDFISKIRLRQTCKRLYILEIHDFLNVPHVITCRLTDEVILQHKHIKYLSLYLNKYVTDINHLNLQSLVVYGSKIEWQKKYYNDGKIIEPKFSPEFYFDYKNAYFCYPKYDVYGAPCYVSVIRRDPIKYYKAYTDYYDDPNLMMSYEINDNEDVQ
jgi:hypothetical protein